MSGSGNILIIDDDITACEIVSYMMKSLGHNTKIALSGEDAIAIVEGGFKPNIVVCDISMPGMDGYDVCKTLKANSLFDDTLFIAQTGWDTEERKHRSKEAGFDYHLVKPVDPNQLLEILMLSMKGKPVPMAAQYARS